MDFLLNIDLKKHPQPIRYTDKILLMGSCFTEHIGNALAELKFEVLQNPNGILFGPDAVCKSLMACIHNKPYRSGDLFQLNEVWHSWNHHSRFSATSESVVLDQINASQQRAHAFLKEANWLLITLGSSFSYELREEADKASLKINEGVANCHRAPAGWFNKRMLETDEIVQMLTDCFQSLRKFNPALQIIFTISPVRHIRDGVVENNRSKARLIEAVHQIIAGEPDTFYFPAYELVIDVLRDYRFYDIDLVHPNYPATEYVLEKFTSTCISGEAQQLMAAIRPLVIARKHRPFQPDTSAHKQFLQTCLEKANLLKNKYPFLQLEEELKYFSQ